MEIKKDYDFEDLRNEVWGNACDTLEKIEEADKEKDLMFLLAETFVGIPTITDVNDYLSFNKYEIFEQLDINNDDDDEYIWNELKKFEGQNFYDVLENIKEILSETDKNNDGIKVADKVNGNCKNVKLVFVDNEDSPCYDFELDKNGKIISLI